MIIVGTTISSVKIKVDGCFVDGSQSVTITATIPPNPLEKQIGKDSVLFLNPVTGTLFQEYVSRPLTDAETIVQLKEQNADMVLALVVAGVM